MKVWVVICFANIAGVASSFAKRSPAGGERPAAGTVAEILVAALNVPLLGAYQVVAVRSAAPRGAARTSGRLTCVDRSRRCWCAER
jgi:hypothetical protein